VVRVKKKIGSGKSDGPMVTGVERQTTSGARPRGGGEHSDRGGRASFTRGMVSELEASGNALLDE